MRLIDADALYEHLDKRRTYEVMDGRNKAYGKGVRDAMKDLANAPTVDAIPVVHGRWIDEEGNPVPWCDAHPSSPAFSCWCNQCGEWLVASDEYPVYGLFCPVCGAKMDGEWRGKDAAD